MLLVFSGVFTYLVEAYSIYAASALAANSFLRSSFAGAFPLFGVQSELFQACFMVQSESSGNEAQIAGETGA